MRISDSVILELLKGEWNGLSAGVFENFSVDSRRIKKNGLFFAIRGERTDGHLYVKNAVDNGAIGAIIQKSAGNMPVFLLKVNSVKFALFELGRYARKKLKGKVIGVTGSAGKTTTKEMLNFVLRGLRSSSSATFGNANTEYSLPLFFLNDAKENSDYFVVEMGIQKPGDMNILTDIALPDFGVILNAGKSHLEYLGTVEKVAEEKFNLARFVSKNGGTFAINGDDSNLKGLLEKEGLKAVTFGFKNGNDIRARILSIFPDKMKVEFFSFGEQEDAEFKFSGIHFIYDMLAVIAVSRLLGINLKSVVSVLSHFAPVEGRGKEKYLSGGITIIDETYNSNPLSLEYSLSRFRNRSGELIVIAGDMLELGKKSAEFHKEAGKIIASFSPREVITFGTNSKFISDLCKEYGIKNVCHFDNKDSLLEYVNKMKIPKGAFVFVKGSRGMHMEDVVKKMEERFGNEK